MTIEQDLKTIIGEQAFQIIVLNSQLQDANKKIQDQTPKEETNENK